MKITDIAGFMGSLPSILLGLGALAVGYFGLKRWNETCIDVPFVGKFGGSCPALTPGEGEVPPPEVIDTDVLPTPGDQSCIDKCRFFFGNPLGGAPLFSGVYDWCVKGCTPEAAPVPPPAPESPPPAPESPPPAADNPCAGLKGLAFDIGYNACMAAYALMGGTDETPPPPGLPTPVPTDTGLSYDVPLPVPYAPVPENYAEIQPGVVYSGIISAEQLRAEMYPTRDLAALPEWERPYDVCINGRRRVTEEQAHYDVYNKLGVLLHTTRPGCGVTGDGINYTHYCDC